MTQDTPQHLKPADYDWEVVLSDKRKFHPRYAVLKDNGYCMVKTDGATHYFPPHRIHCVSKSRPDE
jgi:hypothetical protein